MKLLLFDIDGTLIKGNRAGRLALAAALVEVFGTGGILDNYDMGGKTDLRIVTDVLADWVPPAAIEAKLPELTAAMARHANTIYPERGIISCPGVPELLGALRGNKGVILGLLTGNVEATASLKLSAAGIDPQQFVVRAYGSDDINRNNLPQLAMRRATELTGATMTGDNVVVIGDTAADIECARAGGARAVAVATGWHGANALAACNPDHLFLDLSDTESVLQVLLA